METIFLIIVLALLVIGLVIISFFALLFLTLLIYVLSHLYPWFRKIAVWAAKPENLFPVLVLAIILLILAILAVSFVSGIIGILLAVVLLLIAALLFILVDLGVLVWIIRLIAWLYGLWRRLLVNIYAFARLQTMKFKIKVDVQKETDWKTKWAEMKNKLSEEAEQARRKISRQK
jgi:hypothetical protein